MKRVVTMVLVVAMVMAFAGIAFAQGPWGHGPRMGMGWGAAGGPGPGWMGGRMMGGGPGACPGFAAAGGGTQAPEAVTEEKAKELATAYADKYFKGYTVERVLPFQGRWATMYQVELKGPKGEHRVLHVNPWGNVRPFGPLAAAE
jgi:hypothetical protein